MKASSPQSASKHTSRRPTSTVKGMTPHQAWYGVKPRVEHLRVLGAPRTSMFQRTREVNWT